MAQETRPDKSEQTHDLALAETNGTTEAASNPDASSSLSDDIDSTTDESSDDETFDITKLPELLKSLRKQQKTQRKQIRALSRLQGLQVESTRLKRDEDSDSVSENRGQDVSENTDLDVAENKDQDASENMDQDASETADDDKSEKEDCKSITNKDFTVLHEIRHQEWKDFKSFVQGEARPSIAVLDGRARYRRPGGKGEDDTVENPFYNRGDIPERIRINSSHLVAFLNTLDGQYWTKGVVMLRPYKLLVFKQEEIRNELRRLQSLWPDSPRDTNDSSEVAAGKDVLDEDRTEGEGVISGQTTSEQPGDSKAAFDDIRLLVQFIDNYIMPVCQPLMDGTADEVSFPHLWYLLRPGVQCYVPVPKYATGAIDTTDDDESLSDLQRGRRWPTYQEGWRVMETNCGRPALNGVKPEGSNNSPGRPLDFDVRAYYIDWDASKFGPCGQWFNIRPYTGKKRIQTLSIYPWSYAPESERARLIERGRAFLTYCNDKPQHRFYSGNSHKLMPSGVEIDLPTENEKPKVYSHVDSEVIVDFSYCLKANMRWTQAFTQTAVVDDPDLASVSEEITCKIYLNSKRTTIIDSQSEQVYNDQEIDRESTNAHVSSSSFLQLYLNSDTFMSTSAESFREEDLALLPDRVFAFVLFYRTFAAIRVSPRHLKPLVMAKDGFKDLKLPLKLKQMVTSLVITKKREMTRRKDGDSIRDPDMVSTKGQGLIILLHGVPGVGKTSTAECVARLLSMPLLPITCGDLGVKAEDVESYLNQKFEQASRWGCILLLDEADVFLAQRTKADLERNALVSVFLRTLEYYNGILFLTTNRVGAMDEAFKSRVHVQLYYPPLNEKQAIAIWKMHLDRLEENYRGRLQMQRDDIINFAVRHFRQSQENNSAWNGRQIKNAFTTAVSLAEFESAEAAARLEATQGEVGKELSNAQETLSLKINHFETVAEASEEFDRYMQKTLSATWDDVAQMNAERANGFSPASLISGMRSGPASYARYQQDFSYSIPQGNHLAPMPQRSRAGRPNGRGARGTSPNGLASEEYGIIPSIEDQDPFDRGGNAAQPQTRRDLRMPSPASGDPLDRYGPVPKSARRNKQAPDTAPPPAGRPAATSFSYSRQPRSGAEFNYEDDDDYRGDSAHREWDDEYS